MKSHPMRQFGIPVFLLGLFAASSVKGITPLEVKAEDSNCLGTVSITEAKIIDATGAKNGNYYLGLWLSGSDYPDLDGTGAEATSLSTVFSAVGNNLTSLQVNGTTPTVSDPYMNLFTYHPILAFCVTGLGDIFDMSTDGTITIQKEFRIPSKAAFKNGAATYYTLDANYTFTRPDDSFSLPSGTWTDALKKTTDQTPADAVGTVTLEGVTTIHPFDASNMNEFLVLYLTGSNFDYPAKETSKQLTNGQVSELSVLDYITLYDASDAVISTSIFQAYVNLWTYGPAFCVGLAGLGNAARIEIKSGMQIPSYAYLSGDTTSATYGQYALAEGSTYFVPDDAKHETGSANVWVPSICTIVYQDEDGNSIAFYDNETIGCGKEYTLRGAPTKEGYTSSWEVASPSGLVLDGLHFTAPAKPTEIIFKAKYTANTYVLTFDGLDNTLNVTYDQAIGTLPEVPAKEGFTNGHWVIGEDTLTAETIWKYAENKKAVAAYDVATCVVTFETNGGSTLEPVTVIYGAKLSLPENPAKDKYLFDGWYFDAALSQAYDASTPVTSSFTLYAKWLECVVITFDTDGGSAIESITMGKGEVLSTPSNNPTKAGYRFAGWYLNGAAYDFSTPVENDITLTAKWEKVADVSGQSSSSSRSSLGWIIGGSVALVAFVGVGIAFFLWKKRVK